MTDGVFSTGCKVFNISITPVKDSVDEQIKEEEYDCSPKYKHKIPPMAEAYKTQLAQLLF